MTLTEVRILSRGGQGGVTAAKLLASAGHLSGKYVQAIPKYGAERKGAPIFADVRISDEHVKTHAPVIPFNTHSWIVLEPSLVDTIPFDELKPGTLVVVNSQEIPSSLKDKSNLKVGIVDAVDIATECGLIRSGTVMVSTTMLGAWIKATGDLVSIESLIKAVEYQFGKGALAEANIQSIRLAYANFEYIST